MFIGEYTHNLDAKGRIIIPAKFREALNTTFILTRGLDDCLTIYSYEQWNKIFERLNKLSTTKSITRQYIRILTSGATECELDNQGRIQIPSFLSKSVAITKECVIIGANDHVEIWDKGKWEEYYENASASFEAVAEELSELLDE